MKLYSKNKVILVILVCHLIVFSIISPNQLYAQDKEKINYSGSVVDENGTPIPYATILIQETEQWGITENKGNFTFKIPKGAYRLTIRCLGYEPKTISIALDDDYLKEKIVLQTKSFALDDVVVTAKQSKEDITTAYEINTEAIEHTQLSSLAEIMTLLPGERTRAVSLLSGASRHISLRGNENEDDNPSFGTAVEVDGIRLSNNAVFYTKKGVDTRIISSENIEKVEVITGIPSVEYGDLTSGIVKVKTKQGVTPLKTKVAINPYQKLIALSKGINLGKERGVLNLSYDYTKAIGNIVSPYTAYVRNTFNVNHTKVFLNNTSPLSLNTVIAGNIGGYNSKADPDNLVDTYVKDNAFNIRGGIDISWQINKKLISKIDFATNINYSDAKYEKKEKHSSASGELAFHGIEEGYFVGQPYEEDKPLAPIQLLKRGHWYQQEFIDEKPINYSAKLKLTKHIYSDKLKSKLQGGVHFSGSGNMGKGIYYGNRAYTPSWREHRYDEEPYLNNLALFAQGTFTYPLGKESSVKMVAGVRQDHTFVKDAKYSNVNAISPRINVEYTFLKNLKIYAGWGKSVKLPSFGSLYIRPSYTERLAFVPGSLADGTTYYAYHIKPNEVIPNKSVKWQKSKKWEIGIRGKLGKTMFSLAYFNNLVDNSYKTSYYYTPFTYYLTTPHQLANVRIPYKDRRYSIASNGTVTVHDITEKLPNEVLQKKEKRIFNRTSYLDNASSVKRYGFEWVVDFGKIAAIATSLRIDGKYHFYKSIDNKIQTNWQGDNQLMSDGQPYQYIGYYYGGTSIANGRKKRELSANATFITHIPKLRLIVSLKVESTFVKYEQWLSEMPNGERSFELDKKDGYIPKPDRGSIYEGNNFVGMYPLYYTSFEDINTKIPFKEKYLWAYDNDRTLFNDLTNMVVTNSYDFQFKPQRYNPYFSANIKVSKEIGKRFKLSFFANNFLNSMQKIINKQTNREGSLYYSGLVVPYYYGMSLQVEL